MTIVKHLSIFSNQIFLPMIRWILIFLGLALLAVLLGFGSLAEGFADIAELLFYIFLVIVVVIVIIRLVRSFK